MNRVVFSSSSPHWATPSALYSELNKEFNFNDDPCPIGDGIGGLLREWGTCTYVNPPYGRSLYQWISKAYLEMTQNKTIVLLLPARTDTKWFHDFCIKATEIRFIKGRLKFGDAVNAAPFPSMVVIFENRRNDANALYSGEYCGGKNCRICL